MTEEGASYRGTMTAVRGRIARATGGVRPVAFASLGTAQERARERHRRFALSAIAAVLARAVAVVVNLITIPLALSTLGTERYGAFVTVSSLVLMLGFTDFGIGSALLNLVSEADGRNDRPAMVRYVSSAFLAMSAVAGTLLVLLALIYPFVDWPALVRISDSGGAHEVGPTLALTFALFALGIPLGVAQRAQMAHQEGFAVSLWQAIGSIAGLIGLVIVARLAAGMLGVALALSGGVIVGSIGNYIAFFHRRSWLRPALTAFSASAARLVLRRGALFFVLQIAASLAFVSDSLIADQVLGPEAAARYSVAQRLYLLMPMVVGLAVTPLWPAYSEALARGDRRWVRGVFQRSVLASMLAAGAGGVILTLFRGPIFSLWVGGDLVPSLSLSLALLVWSVLYCWGAAVVILLNAANVIALQIAGSLAMGLGSVVLKTWFASLFGIEGIAWGLVLAYTVLTFIPYTIFFLRWSLLSARLEPEGA
jgi:O-antigen/teichoic acid export membrane protein